LRRRTGRRQLRLRPIDLHWRRSAAILLRRIRKDRLLVPAMPAFTAPDGSSFRADGVVIDAIASLALRASQNHERRSALLSIALQTDYRSVV